jgi:NAD(P)-dependent dehydrogenase (short-subunit alcohol dehydrogenase family)
MKYNLPSGVNMTGKTCVITGGANGIGRCLVETFAAHSARVAFIDKDTDSGSKLAERLGDKVLFIPGDIAEERTLNNFTRHVIQHFGSIHCLINNACLSRRGILSDCGFENFSYVLHVGVAAPYMLAKLFRGSFAPGASIINVASTRAFMSQADTESYSAAKGGISALTHALAASLSGRVRVNAISPGWIDTGAFQPTPTALNHSEEDKRQHPAGRVGKPEDIAALALFLASDDAGFITGQNFIVDGGMTTQMVYHADHGWSFQVA